MPNPTILTVLADNPALFEAVQTAIEEEFEMEKIPLSLSNEGMGEMVRAHLVGRQCIKNAFAKIARHKTPDARNTIPNRGR